tara:strand:- start:19284 stop:20921 length:1638 start_codon:yes stop_codon:yes gene_type:complete
MNIPIHRIRAKIKNKFSSLKRTIVIRGINRTKFRQIDKSESVLFWNSGAGGWPDLAYMDAVIASSLRLRGHKVHSTISDGSYRAHSSRFYKIGLEPENCRKDSDKYLKESKGIINEFGIAHSFFGEYLIQDDKDKAYKIAKEVRYENLYEFKYEGINIGRDIKSSLIRFLMGKEFSLEDSEILIEYTYAAILNVIVLNRVINKVQPTIAFMSHAIYVDWGPAMRLLLSKNIPVFFYVQGRMPGTFFFNKIIKSDELSPDSCSIETWEKAKSLKVSNENKQKVDLYMNNRYFSNSCSDIEFDLENQETINGFKNRYNLTYEERPIWSIFTHISWDNSCDFSRQIYSSYDEWLEKTFQQIKNNSNVVWLIKIHPAEKDSPSEFNFAKRMEGKELPENIRIVDFDEKLSPFLYQNMIDGGVTVCGNSGIESAIKGKPVILAGSSNYSNKGFTVDCSNELEYFKNLDNAHNISLLTKEQIELAYKYSYLYLFRKQIRLPIFHDLKKKYFCIQDYRLKDIKPGEEKNLSFVCDSIIKKGDFVLPEPQYLD